MRTFWKIAVLTLAVTLAAGCGMNGTWQMQSVVPEKAKANFDFGTLKLNADGTYEATVDYGKGPKTYKGKYTYEAATKKLTFAGEDGKSRTYVAELYGHESELRVWNDGKEKEWIAFMARK